MRKPRLCTQCRYHVVRKQRGYLANLCAHPEASSPVDGEPAASCDAIRAGTSTIVGSFVCSHTHAEHWAPFLEDVSAKPEEEEARR